jgi:hypothetical protein
MNKALPVLCLALSILLLREEPAMAFTTYSVRVFNEYAAKNPDGLNGRTISKARLDGDFAEGDLFHKKDGRGGVFLENMTVRNLTMDTSSLMFARFKNVTFLDCAFYKTDFTGSRFDNVRFVNCVFDGQEPGRVRGHETKLDEVLANNVTFDRVTFGAGLRVEYRKGSILTLRNITGGRTASKDNSLVFGEDIHIRLEDCAIPDRSVAFLHGDSTVYVKRCVFEGQGIAGNARIIFIDNSTILGGGRAQVYVLQNSAVAISAGDSDFETTDVYLAGNTYPDRTSKNSRVEVFGNGARNGNAYIYGGGQKIPLMFASGGNVHIYDADIGRFVMIATAEQNFEALNMRNVAIRKGYWTKRMPRKGNWENVRIYPPVELREKSEYAISGYKVAFPEGIPWRNGSVESRESDRPLEFAMPPVPTLEQLGLAQFWEAVDRGETPEPPKGLVK